ALAFIFFASLMRWNALAATFAPMILLFRWTPAIRGFGRYAVATLAWLAVTFAAYEVNDVLTDEHEHLWHWGYGYVDLAGTIEYMPDMDDATLNKMLDGVPLLYHDNLHARFRKIYNPAYQYHLSRNEGRILRVPANEQEREAVVAAWKRVVLGHPGAYLQYRIDNFRQLLSIDRPPSFSNVYVWFNVIAAPEVIDELGYDAAPSRIQARLIDASIWISLTPLYFTFLYVAICLLLVPLVRERLELALILSAIGYEAQWFFLAATADTRYSQWLAICTFLTAILVVARVTRQRRRGPGAETLPG
ncbi:MAG TPA: hypothetical protein VLB44_18665, partial [Kofleriaceae bacterium]|nr:hypothetical protein [Kofleriaceae bacterium]